MARAHLRHFQKDSAGNAVQGAAVTVKDLAGVDLTLYADPSSGTTVANPITTNSAGLAECWVATAQTVGLTITDNGGTATAGGQTLNPFSHTLSVEVFWPPEAGVYVNVNEPTPIIHVSPTGNDAFDGRWDQPKLTPQAAINATPALGGIVLLSPDSYSHTGLTLKSGLVMRGHGGLRVGNAATKLIYTSSGSGIALDGRAKAGVVLEDVALQYSSTTYTGNLLDLSTTGGFNNRISRCALGGTTSSANGATLVYLPNCLETTIDQCYFDYCNIAVIGKVLVGDQTNGIRIRDCFTRGLGAQTAWIQDAGQGWVIEGNSFEPVLGNAPGAYNETGLGASQGNSWIGNWMGDNGSGVAGNWLKFNAADLGWQIIGNRINVNNAATGILFAVNSTQGFVIAGNFFTGSAGGTAVAFGTTTGHQAMTVVGNAYSSGVAKTSGTIPGGTVGAYRNLIDNGTSIQRDRGTTANRPAAASAGSSAEYYDTTLSKPIWSDGTAWRDAAGAVV